MRVACLLIQLWRVINHNNFHLCPYKNEYCGLYIDIGMHTQNMCIRYLIKVWENDSSNSFTSLNQQPSKSSLPKKKKEVICLMAMEIFYWQFYWPRFRVVRWWKHTARHLNGKQSQSWHIFTGLFMNWNIRSDIERCIFVFIAQAKWGQSANFGAYMKKHILYKCELFFNVIYIVHIYKWLK